MGTFLLNESFIKNWVLLTQRKFIKKMGTSYKMSQLLQNGYLLENESFITK